MDIQINAGLSSIEYSPGPLGVWVFASFSRLPGRGKCSQCGVRRVLFCVSVNDVTRSPGRCGKCAGIR